MVKTVSNHCLPWLLQFSRICLFNAYEQSSRVPVAACDGRLRLKDSLKGIFSGWRLTSWINIKKKANYFCRRRTQNWKWRDYVDYLKIRAKRRSGLASATSPWGTLCGTSGAFFCASNPFLIPRSEAMTDDGKENAGWASQLPNSYSQIYI